jgi:hypothetical protein
MQTAQNSSKHRAILSHTSLEHRTEKNHCSGGSEAFKSLVACLSHAYLGNDGDCSDSKTAQHNDENGKCSEEEKK